MYGTGKSRVVGATHSARERREVEHGFDRHVARAEGVRDDPLRVNAIDRQNAELLEAGCELQELGLRAAPSLVSGHAAQRAHVTALSS